MENFKIESRYLKFCYEFRPFIRCMKAAFYRPDYENVFNDQKTWLSICFKICCQAFEMLSQAFETLGWTFETLGWGFETPD